MKNVFFPLLFLFAGIQTGQAQLCGTINLDYDNAGNRIARYDPCVQVTSGGEDRNQSANPDSPPSASVGNMRVIPNPATGVFTLDLTGVPPEAQVFIFDAGGKQVFHGKLGDGRFDASAYAPGHYAIHLVYNNIYKSAILAKPFH